MKKHTVKEMSSKFTNDKIFSTFTYFLFVYLIVLVSISYPDTIHFWGGWKLALIMRTIGSVFPVYFISYYFLDKYNKYCITRDRVNNPVYITNNGNSFFHLNNLDRLTRQQQFVENGLRANARINNQTNWQNTMPTMPNPNTEELGALYNQMSLSNGPLSFMDQNGNISRVDAKDVDISNLKKEKKTLEELCVALRKELDDVKKVKKKIETEYNIEKESKDAIGWLDI